MSFPELEIARRSLGNIAAACHLRAREEDLIRARVETLLLEQEADDQPTHQPKEHHRDQQLEERHPRPGRPIVHGQLRNGTQHGRKLR